MDLSTLVALMRRHLRIALVGAVALVASCGYVLTSVPLTQSVTGSVVLLSPPLSHSDAVSFGQLGAQNPMLSFSDALLVNANLLVKVLSSPTYTKQLAAQGATAAYTVATSNDGVVPLVAVTAKSTQAAAAERTAQIVLEAARQELDRRQAAVGAPASTFIRTETLVAPSTATASWKGRIQDLLEVALVVILDTFLLALAVDWVTSRRAAARAATAEGSGEDPTAPEADHPGRPRRARPGKRPLPATVPVSPVAAPEKVRVRRAAVATDSAPGSRRARPPSASTAELERRRGWTAADDDATGTDGPPGVGDRAAR
jgi:hypothetical protein